MPAPRSHRSRRAASAVVSLLVVLALLVPAIPASAAMPPVEAPVITAPADGASAAVEPQLTWMAVAGAGRYAVQIAVDDTFRDPVHDVVTEATAATPELDLAPGTWHWRVAVDDGGARGPWAGSTFVKTASLAAPGQVAPADGATFEHPAVAALAWTPVDGAASYEVQLADNPALAEPFVVVTRTTQLVATFARPGESYAWRVRAVARNGETAGPWSDVRSFVATGAGVPTGLQPDDGAAVRDIEVGWDPLPGAAGYQVEFTPGPDPDWDAAATRSYATAATRFLVEDPVVPAGTTLAWRVRAVTGNPDDPAGPWTAPRFVSRTMSDPPVLLAPTSGSTTGEVVTLAWAPAVRASHYEVQVSADPAFATGVATYSTTEPTLDVTTGEQLDPYVLVKGTTYHWRVRGVDTDTVHLPGLPATGWSAVRTFTWDPPVATLLMPADGATLHLPTLAWEPAGARQVRVTVEDAAGQIVARAVTWATTYTPEASLDPADGPFTWYVERVSLPGGDSDTVAWRSAERSFQLEAISPAAVAPDPVEPAPGSHSLVTPSLSWAPVAGAHHYRVYQWLPDVLPDPLPHAWSPALSFPAWTYPHGNLDTISYSWQVLAFDAEDAVIARGAPSTFVLDQVPSPVITSPADCVATGCPVYADTPRLAWEPVPGATGYAVEHAGTGGGSVGGWTTITSAQPTVDPLSSGSVSGAPAGSAWWRVAACVEQRCNAGDEHRFLLTLPAPVMVSPAGNEAVDGPQVTLAWKDLLDAPAAPGTTGSPRTEAFAYHAALIGSPENGTASQLGGAPSRTWVLPPGSWTWELWGYAGSGRPTAHAFRSIAIEWAGPDPVAPAGGIAVARTPLLAWAPAAYADAYEVEVFAGTVAAAAARVLQATTREAAYAPFDELDAGTYTWRVRSTLQGIASSWGATAMFTILPSASPVLVEPASGAVSGTGRLRFAWESVAGATAYRLQTDDDPSFGTPRESVVTGQPRWVPLGAYPSGSWWWRVQAVGPSGAALASSPARHVEVDLVEPVVSAPVESIARARASTGAAAPVDLSWHGSDTQAGEVHYDVRRSVDGESFVPWAAGITRATARPILTPGRTYRFAVQAIDAAGHRSTWAYGRTFRVRAYADGASSVTYRGSWRIARNSRLVGGSAHWSTAAGARATFRFTGRQVAWVAAVGPGRGKARVYVDGRYATAVNLYATAPGTRRVVFTRSWATSGIHSIRVEVVGTPRHARVDVDGFVTLR